MGDVSKALRRQSAEGLGLDHEDVATVELLDPNVVPGKLPVLGRVGTELEDLLKSKVAHGVGRTRLNVPRLLSVGYPKLESASALGWATTPAILIAPSPSAS